MWKGLFGAALMALLATGLAAQDNGPFQLPLGGFGVPGFGQRQALPSHAMEEARRLGLFEETLGIRSGWIDRVAKMTGRLDIMTAAKNADGQPMSLACTGTAITPRYILTNAHCLKSSGRHRAISVLFLPNYRDARRRNVVAAYPVSLIPVERGGEDALDYASLRLEQPLKDYQQLGLAIRDPGPGEPLVVIGHPEGQPLHLSRGRCRSDTDVPVDGGDVVHGCATLAGSSGSLVFSSEGQIVGLHYWGGSLLGGRQVNRAIRMAALVRASRVLSDVFAPNPSAPAAPPEQLIVPRQSPVDSRDAGQDRSGRAERLRQGCLSGQADECTQLGFLYWVGGSVPKDPEQEARFNTMGCDGGSMPGCHHLGDQYIQGRGVQKNKFEAVALFQRACNGDYKPACKDLKEYNK